jgi:hypothetical protein
MRLVEIGDQNRTVNLTTHTDLTIPFSRTADGLLTAPTSDKSLVKGLVPVACRFRTGLTMVLRNPGAGFA